MVIIAVAADMNAKLGGACDGRRSDGDGRNRGQHVRQVPHGLSPLGLPEKNNSRSAPLQEPARNFLEQAFTIIASLIRETVRL
jgi:hypothetical protein